MRTTLNAMVLAGSLVATLAMTGCTQMPTEKQGISDLRPQISFNAGSDRARMARIMIDGMDVGSVSDYISGVAAMRIQPGTHLLRVVSGDEMLIEEKIYMGDGINRTFNVK